MIFHPNKKLEVKENLYLVVSLSLAYLVIVYRCVFPRYRYDLFMNLCWKMFLLFVLTVFLFIFFF